MDDTGDWLDNVGKEPARPRGWLLIKCPASGGYSHISWYYWEDYIDHYGDHTTRAEVWWCETCEAWHMKIPLINLHPGNWTV